MNEHLRLNPNTQGFGACVNRPAAGRVCAFKFSGVFAKFLTESIMYILDLFMFPFLGGNSHSVTNSNQ